MEDVLKRRKTMRFTLKNALKVAKEHGACSKRLAKFEGYSSLRDALRNNSKRDISHAAFWLGYHVPEWRPVLVKYVTNPTWAYFWAMDFGDVQFLWDRIIPANHHLMGSRKMGSRRMLRHLLKKNLPSIKEQW